MRSLLQPAIFASALIVAFLFASCSESEPSTMPEISSFTRSSSSLAGSSGDSSSDLSSSGESSSSSGGGEEIPEDRTVPVIKGLQVSRWVNAGELLLRWEVPEWDPELVTGVVIERDDNYTGWVPQDTATGETIRQGLWLDQNLPNSTQMKYRYRAYTIISDSTTGKSRRSPFTEITGTMALDEWGFLSGEFDIPSGLTGCWHRATNLELTWNVKKMAQAGGWVIQALAAQDTVLYIDSTRAGDISGFDPTGNAYVVRGTWIDLDTLSEDNNHYHIFWPGFSVFRIYAYYLDEFKLVTSEYSPEVNLSTYDCTCTADRTPYKTAGIAVDTTKSMVEWTAPNAFYDCQQFMMNGAYYPPNCGASAWSCITIADEFGDPSPCWNLGMEGLAWNPGMPAIAAGYNARGVALDRTGTALWVASPWRRK